MRGCNICSRPAVGVFRYWHSGLSTAEPLCGRCAALVADLGSVTEFEWLRDAA